MSSQKIQVTSFGAIAVRCFGYALIGMGISGIFSGLVGPGIAMIAAGLVLGVWATSIAENKCFKVWKQQMEQKNLIPAIRNSVSTAISAYNAYPSTKTLEYIRTLNPEAAKQIAQMIAEKSKEKK